MQNQFPLWKNLLIVIVFVVGAIYALPNVFGDDPSVQVSTTRTTKLGDEQLSRIAESLKNAGLVSKSLEKGEDRVLIRFDSLDDQLKAADLLKTELGNGYTVALNLAPATPGWLEAIGAKPMYLGLDLRGGVHFLLEVDMIAAVKQAEERYVDDIRLALRTAKIRYVSINSANAILRIKLKDAGGKAAAMDLIGSEFRGLNIDETDDPVEFEAMISEAEIKEIKKFAIAQNMTTLRNRVNELGVAEPVIQQQGENRIVVQLPGVQDTARAKEILGATATLEFRMVDTEHDVRKAMEGRTPVGSRLYYERNGSPILLQQRIIVTGDQIIDASSGLDQNGSAAVFVTLNGVGAKKMGNTTQKNVGKPMAVVFIENKVETKEVEGQSIRSKRKLEEVINVATIQGVFSKRFQITGLDSPQEARNLA
ncbi:MAG: SecDF P1 head subdomain-containing protein, partial [Gammaproteobacteria bacterium]